MSAVKPVPDDDPLVAIPQCSHCGIASSNPDMFTTVISFASSGRIMKCHSCNKTFRMLVNVSFMTPPDYPPRGFKTISTSEIEAYAGAPS